MKKDNSLNKYIRQELWAERIEATIETWEAVQGIKVPQEARDAVVGFMRKKIKRGIEKDTLMKTFFQIAVTSLLYIKMRRIK